MFTGLNHIPVYFLQPLRLFQTYKRQNLRPDLMAGLTVAIILLPQAIAFTLIAELPPVMGLYAAIVGGIVGALWGSCYQAHTGPANAISLLVLSVLLTIAPAGTPEFILAAGVVAVLVGLFQLVMGLARLGMLVNFVSHSVIVGFTAGAGILIIIKQIRHLLGLEFSSYNIFETFRQILTHLPDIHWPTMILGLSTMGFIVLLKKLAPKWPNILISMVITSIMVFLLGLDQAGVEVIGQLPTGFPPLVKLPLFDLEYLSRLATGVLAIGAIGLVQTTAIVRAIAGQTGQRLDSNQEFVGQGLANIAAGFFSGYPGAASFARSAINLKAGAQTPLSAIFASLFVLLVMLTLAPLAAYLPLTALAGVLTITAFYLIDRTEIIRIWQGARGDAVIMLATLFGTLFLRIEFAILVGILLSFAHYLMRTSLPEVFPVTPDESFIHFVRQQPHQLSCPQLGILKISGDLYFGAVQHVEDAICQHLTDHPEQRFLLLRMHGVNQCDFRGIQMLEAIKKRCRERGGDLFLMRLEKPVLDFMKTNGFYDRLGPDHFLTQDHVIGHLFQKVLDPAICIYECNARVFEECQNLPKQTYLTDGPLQTYMPIPEAVNEISPEELHQKLHNGRLPLVVDVREPREFKQGHIPQSQLIPLPKILANASTLPQNREIVVVCRSGWRSARAMCMLQNKGYRQVRILRGGMLAWEAAGLEEVSNN